MKNKERSMVFMGLLALMIQPGFLFAHGTDYRILHGPGVVAIEFFYSDREPMRYAEVLIFSPDDAKLEYQNGRTDKEGRFAFCPPHAGLWQIRVNDGVGHAVQAEVAVQSQADGRVGPKGAQVDRKPLFGEGSILSRVCLGLSVLLNVFMGLYIWKRKSGWRNAAG